MLGFGLIYIIRFPAFSLQEVTELTTQIFTFFLVGYFWYYDRESPGFVYDKRYQPRTLPRYFLNFVLILPMCYLFVASENPQTYSFGLAILYVFDIIWCFDFSRVLKHRKSSRRYRDINLLCMVFDGATAFFFGMMYLITNLSKIDLNGVNCFWLSAIIWIGLPIFEFLFQISQRVIR